MMAARDRKFIRFCLMSNKILQDKLPLNHTLNPLASELRAQSDEIVWIYWVKAIGIFLVLWGHEFLPHVMLSWIYSFHIPLFFFISGYLTKHKHTIAFGPYIKKYAYSLLMPYVCLGMLAYVLWFLKNIFHPGAELESIALWSPLWGMFYATGMPIYSLIHSSALWFLPALFSVFVFHWIVKKFIKSDLFYFVAAILLFFVGHFSFMLLNFRLPMGIENAMLGFLFFATGNVLHKKHIGFYKSFRFMGGVICLAFQVLLLYFQKWPIPSLLSGQIGNPVLYYITAMLGVFFLVGAVSNLPAVTAVVTVSKNTLAIFALQTSMRLIVGGVLFLMHIQFEAYVSKIIYGLASAVFDLVCLCIFAEIVRKRCPVMLGEK
jgi:fucose 4-O-acetylase-like acetyltransferase